MKMNTKAKILAVGASGAIIATSFAGCAENSALNFYTSMQAASEITDFNYTMSFNGDFTSKSEDETLKNITFGLDMGGTTLKSGDSKATIALKASADGNGFDKVTLTDVYCVDNVVYINIKSLINAIPKMAVIAGEAVDASTIDETANGLTEAMGITTDYVSIDLKKIDTSELIGEEAPDVNDIDTEKLRDSSQMAFVKLTASLESALKDVKPQVVGAEKDKYTLLISNDNYDAICDALINYIQNDFVNVLTDIANTAEQNGDADFAKTIREEIPDAEGIASAVESIKAAKEDSASMGVFKIDCWTKFNGNEKKHNREFDSSFGFNTDNDEMIAKVSVLMSIDEVAADTAITPPSADNCYSLDEYIENPDALSDAMMSMYGLDADMSGYSDSDWSDYGSDWDDYSGMDTETWDLGEYDGNTTNSYNVTVDPDAAVKTDGDVSYVQNDYDDYEFGDLY